MNAVTLPAIVVPDPASLTAAELALGVVDILGADLVLDDSIVVFDEPHRVEYFADGAQPGTRVALADRGRWQTTVHPQRYLRCLPRTGVAS